MKSIQNILQTDGNEFLDNLMNDYLVVYEKLNASTLSFRRIKNELKFYKGRDNEEITSLNETLYSYFKEGIEYIRRVSLIFYMELPEGWLFRMQYFNPNSQGLINYEQQPKNNLVLSCIDTGNSIIEDLNVLRRWAERFQTDVAEPIFSGFLSEFQKEKLMNYANGLVDYEGVSFSQYIISLLNPNISHSAYSDSFNTGIDSFIFKFYNAGSKKCVPLKLVDPYMEQLIKQNKDKFGTNSGTENEIILANFIAWLQTVDMKEVDIEGDTNDERYLDLLCKLFNMYMEKEQKMFKDMKSEINESYRVNIDKIKNSDTAELLKKNPNMERIFQVIVGSFMNQKDDMDPNSIMDDNVKELFNKEVTSIKKLTDDKDESVKSFTELMKSSMNNVEAAAKKSHEEKVMSFTELMDKIGYEPEEEPESEEQTETSEESKSDESTEEKPDTSEDKQTDDEKQDDDKSDKKEGGEKSVSSDNEDDNKSKEKTEELDKEEKSNDSEEDKKDDSEEEKSNDSEEDKKDDSEEEKSDDSEEDKKDESEEEKSDDSEEDKKENSDEEKSDDSEEDKKDSEEEKSDDSENKDSEDKTDSEDEKSDENKDEQKEEKSSESDDAEGNIKEKEKEKTAPAPKESKEKPEKPEKEAPVKNTPAL